MSVNGITSANSSYTTPQTTAKTKVSQATNTADAKDIGVVYETSSFCCCHHEKRIVNKK